MINLFENNESILLEDAQVLLRSLTIDDVENLISFSINEPELWKYSMVPAAGKENLIAYINQAIEAKQNGKELPFIVFDKKQNAYAGSTRFYDIQLKNKSMQLGYTWYGKQFQGTGLNKHCKYLMLSFAFEQLQMERIEFRADNLNLRSIAAMKSIGCKVEGVLRSTGANTTGGRRDSIVLSILKSEWENELKAKLFSKLI